MARPSYTIEFGFGVSARVLVIGRGKIGQAVIGASAEDGVSWTPVSGVREIAIERGRQDELGRFEAGRCTLVLENDDGRFSPENTGGSYYPNILPMRRVRVKATFNSVEYPLFYGWVERWVPTLRGSDHLVTVEATDLFLRLAQQEVNASFGQEKTGARFANVLTHLEWPSSLQDLDAGQSTLPAVTISEKSALQHLQDALTVEDGQHWVNGAGKVVFRDRHARLTDAVSKTSQATFGGASGLPFRSAQYEYGIDQVYNDVRVTRSGGTEQSASDTDSQRKYGVRTLRRSSEHFLSDAEAKSYAGWLKGQHREPVPRLKSIGVEAGGDDTLWPHVLGREINDRITVVHQFPGNAGLNRAFWIEGGRHHITDGLNAHAVEWLLSKADPVPWFIIGHATNGKIGTARIAY